MISASFSRAAHLTCALRWDRIAKRGGIFSPKEVRAARPVSRKASAFDFDDAVRIRDFDVMRLERVPHGE